ncbi:MAG: PAS domain-containing protein [Spirochaetales bacterium]|nr:PAS domain-containing protein [Spirochaetales bacterium]
MAKFEKICILLLILSMKLVASPPQVAIIYGPDKYNKWTHDFTHYYMEKLESSANQEVEVYIHYIGIGVEDPLTSPYFDDMVKMISKRKYDIVIPMMSNVGKLVHSLSQSIFMDSTKIFVLPDEQLIQIAEGNSHNHFVKSASAEAIKNTIELIPKLFPNIEEILFISGVNPMDIYYMNIAKELVRNTHLKSHFLEGVPINQLIETYKKPSHKQVMFFLSYEKDNLGHLYFSSHIAERICKNVSLPVFGFIETLVGTGFLGGSLTSSAYYAEDTANKTIEILGSLTEPKDMEKHQNTRYVFEWPQLKRFDILEKQLPANSIVKFKVISDFEKNLPYFVAGLLILLLQLTFILFLLYNRYKLKKTKSNLQKERDYIQKINQTSPIGITVVDKNGQINYANHEAERILDLNKSTIEKRQYDDPLWKITSLDGSPFEQKSLPFFQVKSRMDTVYNICHAINFDNGIKKLLSVNASPILNEKKEFNGMLAILQDITESVRIQDAMEKSLKEKETLLQELYHRTKNNMQVICSMLNLQRKFTSNKEVQEQLQEAENRINSMALVHQKLYQSKSLSNIQIKDFVEDLINLIRESYQITSQDIDFDISIDDFQIVIDIAIPLGLVINELLSNIFKHAFPDQHGHIQINLNYKNNKDINLIIKDNGQGVPKNFDFFNSNTLGLQTIISIIETQLGGEIKFESNDGLGCIINFENIIYHTRL